MQFTRWAVRRESNSGTVWYIGGVTLKDATLYRTEGVAKAQATKAHFRAIVVPVVCDG